MDLTIKCYGIFLIIEILNNRLEFESWGRNHRVTARAEAVLLLISLRSCRIAISSDNEIEGTERAPMLMHILVHYNISMYLDGIDRDWL